MKKGVIVLVVLVIVAILAGTIYFVLRGNSPSNTSTGTTGMLPPVATSSAVDNGTSSFPTGSTFQIGTAQGAVTVSNFYKTMNRITEDNETVVLGESGSYSIVYNRDDSSFIIDLTWVPGSLQDARDAAEAVFLNQVGVSKSDACKLNVGGGVVDKESQYYGDSFGLSFCTSTVIQ